MVILERMQSDVKDAMRARDSDRTTALRMLVSELQKEAKSKLRDLDESEEIAVLTRERKKRVEAAEAFENGGAQERAANERAQAAMIESYLPEQVDEAEVERIVAAAIDESGATGPQQMGAVMKLVMPKLQGRADGKLISQTVQRLLAGGS